MAELINTYDVSVVIPVYNVEEYLRPCLDSMLRQGDVNLEIVMINDGSTDSSEQIAMEYVEKYENFKCYTIPNGGLGHARNYAVERANGKYVTFFDSDDIIPDTAYERMFKLAEKDQSDFVISNVARFNSTKFWPSSLHQYVFRNVTETAQIYTHHDFIYDTISCNKMVRRDFFLEHNFKFPENILYEDIPVTIPMHVLAKKVSVMNSIGYLWRVRDGASKSITQSTEKNKNLIDRLTIVRMLDKFFKENVTDESLLEAQQIKTLEVDLVIFINSIKNLEKENALEVLHYIKEYVEESINPEYIKKLSIINQQKYKYVLEENVEALWELFDYQKKFYAIAPLTETSGVLTTSLPDDLFTVEQREVTREISRSSYRKFIDNIIVNGNKIDLTCHIYKRRLNIKDFSEQKIQAWLYNEMSRNRIPLKVEPVNMSKLTKSQGCVINPDTGITTNYNYDGTGFKISLDFDSLENFDNNYGRNKILVSYNNRYSEGLEFLGGCDSDTRKEYNHASIIKGSQILKINFTYMNEIEIFLEKEGLFADKISLSEDESSIDVSLSTEIDNMQCSLRVEEGELNVVKVDGKNYKIDISNMQEAKNYFLLSDKDQNVFGRERGIEFLESANGVFIKSSVKTGEYRIEKHCWLNRLTNVKRHNCKLSFNIETVGDISLIGKVIDAKLGVSDPITGQMRILSNGTLESFDNKIVSSYCIDFADEELLDNCYSDIRGVQVIFTTVEGNTIADFIYGKDYFKEKFFFETLKVFVYRGAAGSVKIQFSQRWRKSENTAQKRSNLTIKNYPKYREEKINPKQIVFESMWGTKYSCNPQALYEYIDENYPEYECVWFLRDPRTPIKGNGIRVRRGSQESYHYLATAKYFVNNVNFGADFVKRDGQIEIQTMHGTPLKTIGLDVVSDFPNPKAKETYIEKNKNWDYLIVQGEFMEDKGKPIYEFEKEVLKTGYPRTDRLFNLDASRIDSIKETLGIPKDKKIILYAPTWRIKNHFDMELDLEKMREELSDEYVLLVRLHHFSSSGYTIPADNKFIFDLNSYEYVEDLYLISDIMITDYSSVMFDYALLNKPMIFFTYDMEEYCDTLRGLYVDFSAEAPGPIVFNTYEVIQAVLHIDEELAKCSDRIEAFNKKYLTYECPNSSEQIFKTVFDPENDLKGSTKKANYGKSRLTNKMYKLFNSDFARKLRRTKHILMK